VNVPAGGGTGPGGVSIAPGVFYLGGWRLALDAAVDLAQQPDWLDQPPLSITTGNFLVALLLNEQTVCAVEDQALREVALGGPDTAARARLMQHFLRLKLDTATCAAGAKLVQQDLAADGVTLDPATLKIMSQARLQAGFVPGPTSTDPCTPAAAGGYLGADNQLVRVTITAYDATAKTGTLLWSWNNASILYRATLAITGTTPDPFTLTLIGTPVDGEHAPQFGQAVARLRRPLAAPAAATARPSPAPWWPPGPPASGPAKVCGSWPGAGLLWNCSPFGSTALWPTVTSAARYPVAPIAGRGR
jgi:hypothetical protein